MVVIVATGILDRSIGDDAVGGQQHGSDGRRVEQCGPVDLGRSQHSIGDEVAVGEREGVEPEGAFALADLGDHHGPLLAGVVGDGLKGHGHRGDDRLDAVAGVVVLRRTKFVECGQGPKEADASTRNDALLDGGAGGMQGILDPGLLLLEFGFARRAHIDLGHAPGQLGQTLLKLLAIVVGVAGGDLVADQGDPVLDVRRGTRTFDDGALVGGDHDLLGPAQLADADLLEIDPEILHDGLAAGEDREITQHRLAAVAVARCLDGTDLGDAPQLVDDKGRQRLTGDILRDHEQRLLGLDDLLEDGNDLLDGIDLVLVDQDVGLVELDGHRIGVGHEVRAEVAAVELHAFDHLDVRLESLALLDGDDAVLADLLERLGHDAPDLGVVVGGDGRDVLDLVLDRTGEGADAVNDRGDCFAHSPHECVGIHTGTDVLETGSEQGLGQDRGGRRAVARLVAGLGGRLAHEPGPHVLDGVPEFDLLGDGDAVLGDGGSAPALVEHCVSAAWAEGRLDRAGEFLDSLEQGHACLPVEGQFLDAHWL